MRLRLKSPATRLFTQPFIQAEIKTSKFCVTGLCAGKSPGPVNSPHKWPVTRKMFPFDDVIMTTARILKSWWYATRQSRLHTLQDMLHWKQRAVMMATLLSLAGSHYVNQSPVTTKWYYDNFRFQRSLCDPLYLPGCYQIRRSQKTWNYRAVERSSRHMDTMDSGRSPAPSISASCLPIF